MVQMTQHALPHRCAWLFLLPMFLTLHGWPRLSGGEIARLSGEELELVHAVVSAKQAAKVYRQVFNSRTISECNAMRSFPDDSIALRAAWESIRRDIRIGVDRERVELPESDLFRFVGFVEGRLKQSVPEWWVNRLKRAKGNREDTLIFSAKDDRELIYLGDRHLRHDAHHEMTLHDSLIVVRSKEGTIQLPIRLLEGKRLQLTYRCVSLALNERLCVIATHMEGAMAYELMCLQRKTMEELWRTVVWASSPPSIVASGDPPVHKVDVVVDDNHVTVFGATSNSQYIEKFNINDGTAVCRFGTSY